MAEEAKGHALVGIELFPFRHEIDVLRVPATGDGNGELFLQVRAVTGHGVEVDFLDVDAQRGVDAGLGLHEPDELEVAQPRNVPPKPVIGQRHVKEHEALEVRPEGPDIGGGLRGG